MPAKKRMGILGAVIAVGLLTAGVSAQDADELPLQIRQLARQLQRQYGFQVAYERIPVPAESRIAFLPAAAEDAPQVLKFLWQFQEELQRYPPSFFLNSRLKAVVLVKRQFYDERPAEGLYNAVRNVILLDFKRHQDHPQAQRHNIHHELYHMIEEQSYWGWEDGRWEAVNDPGFEYGQAQGLRPGSNPHNYFAPALPGFLSYYGMTAAKEDRAEIFAAMMMPSQARLLQRWAAKDEILRRKVDLMKTYIVRFCPDMNDNFWLDILAEDTGPEDGQ